MQVVSKEAEKERSRAKKTMEDGIAAIIVDAAVKVHRALGPGLFESVYQRVLVHELHLRNMEVRTQVPVAVQYEDLLIEDAFRADMIVGNLVIVELKSLERTAPVHKKQVLTYLKLTNLSLGLLLNFGAPLMRDGITRLVHNLPQ
jgi:GxxExxY protein